jgi:hypothetical protein
MDLAAEAIADSDFPVAMDLAAVAMDSATEAVAMESADEAVAMESADETVAMDSASA